MVAAVSEQSPPVPAVARQLSVIGWDSFEVWRRCIKEPRAQRYAANQARPGTEGEQRPQPETLAVEFGVFKTPALHTPANV